MAVTKVWLALLSCQVLPLVDSPAYRLPWKACLLFGGPLLCWGWGGPLVVGGGGIDDGPDLRDTPLPLALLTGPVLCASLLLLIWHASKSSLIAGEQ